MLKDVTLSLKKKLYECNLHVEKLNDAKAYLQACMPLTLAKYSQGDKFQSSFIDQLNFRFSKLQDTIVESILRGVIILSGEDIKKMTFIDVLNRLEGLEVVQKNEWLKLREVRNEIAHEYSFDQEVVVAHINLMYEKTDELVDVYKKLVDFVEEKSLLVDGE
jgi:uncharacterized protein with HEPN domain